MLSLDSVTQSQTFLRPSASFCWSLNLARVYNESLSNGYSCRPGLPELPEFALCPMCTPALLQLLPGVTTASQCFPPHGTSTAATDWTQWLAHQGNSAALTRIPTSSVNTFSLLKFIRIPWAMFVSPRENQFSLCSTS